MTHSVVLYGVRQGKCSITSSYGSSYMPELLSMYINWVRISEVILKYGLLSFS